MKALEQLESDYAFVKDIIDQAPDKKDFILPLFFEYYQSPDLYEGAIPFQLWSYREFMRTIGKENAIIPDDLNIEALPPEWLHN